MLHGPVTGKLFRLALPIALTIICEQLLNTADVFVLGHFVGAEAMAASGNDMPVVALLVTLLVGLSIGTTVVIAQHLGAGRSTKARAAVHTSLTLGFVMGIFLAFLGEGLTVPFLNWLMVPQAVFPLAENYLRIFFAGLPFLAICNFAAAVFRAAGDGRTPLYSLIFAAVLNLLLDLGAVFLGWGLAGVIMATVISYAVNAVLLCWCLARRKDEVCLDVRAWQWDGGECRAILRIGLPAGLQGMVFAVSNLVVQSAINSLGPDVMAASSAAFTVEANVYAFVDGFGQAATTFVGQNFGAQQLARCFAITRRALLAASGSLAAVSLVCCLLAVPLMQCFTSDADIIRLGALRIYFVTGIQCLNAVIEVLSGSLRGFGISLPPAAVTLLGTCGTRVAWVEWAFPLQPTFFVLLMGYPLSWLLTAALLAGVYYWARSYLIQG